MSKLLIITMSVLTLWINKSCNSDNTMTIWVNGYQTPCDRGVGLGECMQIFEGEDLEQAEWRTFYDHIEGFEFKPGTLQRIKVKVEDIDPSKVPADGSSKKYTLVEQIETREMPENKLQGAWILKEINGQEITDQKHIPTLIFDENEPKVSGSDGCNNYFGTIESINEQYIKFGPLAGTRKMCPDMTMSKLYNDAMTQVSKFMFSDNQLTFQNEAGVPILVFSRADDEPKAQLHDIWVATSIDGNELDKSTNLPRLEIFLNEKRVAGNDGCNDFSGEIKNVTSNQLEFGPVAATLKMCPDMTIPDQFGKALSQSRRYKLENLTLILSDTDGKELIRFKKVD